MTMIFSSRLLRSMPAMACLCLAAIALTGTACRRPAGSSPSPSRSSAQADSALVEARKGFVTTLIKKEGGKEEEEPAAPPEGLFERVRYPSPAGGLAAYLSPDPGDGAKHPLVIWLTGGFSNSLSSLPWADGMPRDNDQSAAAYRKAGLAMMYPSLRGGGGNPGFKEGCYGEVDDVLAAAEYAARLPWVDPTRIYLGGHSTGGTLALLTAEAAPEDRFRAVISFGPADSVASYGQKNVPFSVKDAKERFVRAPIEFLAAIPCPTFVIEGGEGGNGDALEAMRKRSRNPQIDFHLVEGQSHFSVLAPLNAMFARKILADGGAVCGMSVTAAEIDAAILESQAAAFFPAGDARQKFGHLIANFYLPAGSKADAGELKSLIAAKLGGIPVVADFKNAPKPPFMVLRQEQAPFENFELPEESYFEHAGRGMTAADVKAVLASREAIGMVLVVQPGEDLWAKARAFNEIAGDYAGRTKAFVADEDTREWFHRDAWVEKRVKGWGDAVVPDLRNQITIHLYRKEDDSNQVRAITLGMEKFGLPDVAIESLVSSENRSAGSLINVVCQQLASRPQIADPAAFPLDLATLEPAAIAADYRADLFEKGTGKAVLALMEGTPDEGDPDNAQLALDFRHGAGASEGERRQAVLAGFWGSRDALVSVKHDAAIEQASAAARVKLAGLKESFRKGLPPGDRLMVKGPFARDDGQGVEWMWIELLRWEEGDVLKGSLRNDPFFIKKLKSGAQVEIKLADAFDYLMTHKDGSMEGNETGKLMQQQQQKEDGKAGDEDEEDEEE